MSAGQGHEPQWFACRTRSRAEKKAALALQRCGVEPYVPLVLRRRQWADRVRHVEFPLFPGYVFARFAITDLVRVLRCPPVVQVVHVDGRPLPVSQEELDGVRRLVETARRLGIEPHPADFFEPGQPVVVASGPFQGMRGVLVERRGGRRVIVKLDAIRQAVSVELPRRSLRLDTRRCV